MVVVAGGDVTVDPVIDVAAQRFEAQANLVEVGTDAAVRIVVPGRQTDDAVDVAHVPAPTGADVGAATTVVVTHQGSGIDEDDCFVPFDRERDEGPGRGVTCLVSVQAAAA
jgi:hypothetical protein